MLAGGHCIPVQLPQAARLVWHKLYASTKRQGFPEKAAKDQQQALVLGAVLADTDSDELVDAFAAAPKSMLSPVKPLLKILASKAEAHPAMQEVLRQCLGR